MYKDTKESSDLEIKREFSRIRSFIIHRLNIYQKNREKAKRNLEKCLDWQKVFHEGELLKSNFHLLKRGMLEIRVSDWEDQTEKTIPLSPKLSPNKEVEARFTASRKLKRGIKSAEKYLQKTQEELEKWLLLASEFEAIKTLSEVQNFEKKIGYTPRKENIRSKPLPSTPYREYLSASGLKIWVGKSAKDNEKLTFSLARGSDFWFHVMHASGSHVVLRIPRGEDPDQEAILDAVQLALYHSKAKERREGEVCMTQCKFVSRFGKRHPGKVQIANYRTLFTKFDSGRIQDIKDRK
jgi:predicted ribosome quality control (RQC) complex YloA/Tae2 family protein